MGQVAPPANRIPMADNVLKRYIFASDFDQTLTFNDSGYVLAELVGISIDEFERKAKGMAKINLVQQGAELAYLTAARSGIQGQGAQRAFARGRQAYPPEKRY